jgi:hypothetical protein
MDADIHVRALSASILVLVVFKYRVLCNCSVN